MIEGEGRPRQLKKKPIVAVALFAAAGFVLILALVISATSSSAVGAIDSDSYAAELKTALAGAEAATGETLVTETDCATCHLTGAGRTAPLFDGLALVAADRRPPLSAEQYLYEAIVFPSAHLVAGYADAMPRDYGQRFSLADIGHMIVYLLTYVDEEDES